MRNIALLKEIFTIGHSTRSAEELLDMLKAFQIKTLVDVRSYPGSGKFPQFNKETLKNFLEEHEIEYIHMKDLGGRRRPKVSSKNTAWRSTSFRGYADYMETEKFQNAIENLEEIAFAKKTVFMCSEAVWWRCHRALISDYLKIRGWKVMHIMGREKVTGHPYTSPAKIIHGELIYEE